MKNWMGKERCREKGGANNPPLPHWVAALSRSERKGRPNPPIASIALPAVTLPTVTLAGHKKPHSELEDDVEEALKLAQHWEKLAKETKRDKVTLEKRALRDVDKKDEEIVKQAKATQRIHEQLANEVRDNQTLRILAEEKTI
jgi:hypothetical protein